MQFTEKSFNGHTIFNIKNSVFESGLIHGIIGANGVGKTTLLRCIAGLDKSFKGEITYNEKKYDDTLVQKITYISQKPYMLQRSVFDNVAYPLQIRKSKNKLVDKNGIENKVTHILNQLEIDHLKAYNARVLSAGEREKVSLARGLVFNPELILMDEPTASIDPKSIPDIEKVIVNYQRSQNATVILVTHNLSQAIRMCDTISLMENNTLRRISREALFESIEERNKLDQLMTQNYRMLEV